MAGVGGGAVMGRPRGDPESATGPPSCGKPGLLGRHPDAGVEADRLGVEVAVGQQLDRQRRELVRAAQALREEDDRAERRLELLGGIAGP